MKRNAEKVRLIEGHAKRCGITPSALLIRAGKHPSYMARWRSGERGISRATMNLILAVEPERGAA